MARQICKIEADVWNDWGSVSKYSILSILFQLTEIEIVIYIYYRRQSGLLVIQVIYRHEKVSYIFVGSLFYYYFEDF